VNSTDQVLSRIARLYEDQTAALVLLTKVTAKWNMEKIKAFELAELSLYGIRLKNRVPRTINLLSVGLAGAPEVKPRDPEKEGERYRAKLRW
jgi:hypothetical protein